MTAEGNITVENKLISEKRAISVFHQATRGAHLISHNSSVMLPLQPEAEGDYLHISVTRGPGRLKRDCVLDIPCGVDFEFAGEGKFAVLHKGRRVSIKIPAGPPVWQLKLTISENLPPGASDNKSDRRVVIIHEGENNSLEKL